MRAVNGEDGSVEGLGVGGEVSRHVIYRLKALKIGKRTNMVQERSNYTDSDHVE